ncbi:MFS transporter [Streptomyces sp. NEAU-YJ-81]|uniref:MFS transporter n=1 Tax=Streptomyces sp. NEAU-YJ-81 TaxID=2820288 RepID=UPI001ABC9B3B|nr:MFS transporter [Streptomyces sp. NEAU-YJ-81]MBO3678249.1 MFS transporter [Streptomyces sp. NEAU-YJ-81]
MTATGRATVPTGSAPGAHGTGRWYRQVDATAWRALIAGGGAWLFEVFDVTLLSLTTPALLADFSTTKAQIGLIGTIQAVGMLVGGIAGGAIADRIGRVRSLSYATALYALFTGLAALSPSLGVFALLRLLAGLGMGATWSAGAALIAETWPAEHRGKSGALMQIGWPLGNLLGLGVAAVVTASNGGELHHGGWRILYAVGALPLLLALYIRVATPESASWSRDNASDHSRPRVRTLLARGTREPLLLGVVFVLLLQYMFWGVVSFLPTYLVEVDGISLAKSLAFLLIQQAGVAVGIIAYLGVGDRWGRKPTFIAYLTLTACGILLLISTRSHPAVIVASLLAGMGVSGILAGIVPWAAEMVHQSPIRATAMSVIYHGGRVGAAAAPYIIGSLAVGTTGFKIGMLTTALATVAGIIVMSFAPETKGRELTANAAFHT